MVRHIINLLFLILPASRLFKLKWCLLKFGRVELGKNVSICGRGWVYGRGKLAINSNTWLSPGVILYTHVDAPIIIGENCDIGPGVKFITGSHVIGGSARRAGEGKALPIIVHEGCWIGAESLILGGVTIGSGAVIAAGSVVLSDVMDNTLVAGVPAVVKRHLT